jgi:hypothetical protein
MIRSLIVVALAGFCLTLGPNQTEAQTFSASRSLSPQGYSGGVMTPSAFTLPFGSVSATHDRQLPGAAYPHGYNYQLGFGLAPGFEFVGRLATQDLGCDMFRLVGCRVPSPIRDFSASMKFQLPVPWDEMRWPSLALGYTDGGGAATQFRSYYAVATQRWKDYEFSFGSAQAKSATAPLHGSFAAVHYAPLKWLRLSAEQIGGDRWLSVMAQHPVDIGSLGMVPYVYGTRGMQDGPLTERQWLGFGFNVPLGGGVWGSASERKDNSKGARAIVKIDPNEVRERLTGLGFHEVRLGEQGQRVLIRVENTALQWNILDAAGIALGVIAAAYGDTDKSFRLEISQRSVVVASLEGSARCAKGFLLTGEGCSNGEVLQFVDPLAFNPEPSNWTSSWQPRFRPELVMSPSITTGLGTEYGALDIATAMNFNWLLPLWPGAYFDYNRLVPVDAIKSEDFEQGRAFYPLRFIPITNRKLLHQIIPVEGLGTYFRASVGTAYTYWKGWHLESASQALDGQVRLGLSTARFKYEPYPEWVLPRTPRLVSWRYAPSRFPFLHTELQTGKFWSGDKGYLLTQRFWQGDTSLAIYFRRTQMNDAQPLVSFAGFQIQIPLTPRYAPGFRHFDLRGSNQWNYSAESKVLEKDNIITTGYGVVPRIGDSLIQFMNRDRLGVDYLNRSLPRLRQAFSDIDRS